LIRSFDAGAWSLDDDIHIGGTLSFDDDAGVLWIDADHRAAGAAATAAEFTTLQFLRISPSLLDLTLMLLMVTMENPKVMSQTGPTKELIVEAKEVDKSFHST
jgi:hypothetical protein